MALRYVPSPIGLLRLSGTDDALEAVTLVADAGPEEAPAQLGRTARELTEYFAGTRQEFTVLPKPKGTAFQQAVWQVLRTIPYGRCLTYAQVAAQAGKPSAARAVGNAVGANPCLIVIPCHRVLAAKGLGGFGCGIERKKFLLLLEGQSF